MNQAAEMLFNSVAKIATVLQESANKYKRSISTGTLHCMNSTNLFFIDDDSMLAGDSSDNKSASISKGLKSAITLASSITGTGGVGW